MRQQVITLTLAALITTLPDLTMAESSHEGREDAVQLGPARSISSTR